MSWGFYTTWTSGPPFTVRTTVQSFPFGTSYEWQVGNSDSMSLLGLSIPATGILCPTLRWPLARDLWYALSPAYTSRPEDLFPTSCLQQLADNLSGTSCVAGLYTRGYNTRHDTTCVGNSLMCVILVVAVYFITKHVFLPTWQFYTKGHFLPGLGFLLPVAVGFHTCVVETWPRTRLSPREFFVCFWTVIIRWLHRGCRLDKRL